MNVKPCPLSFYRSQKVLGWSKLFVPDQRFIDMGTLSQERVFIFITWYKGEPAWTHALEGPHPYTSPELLVSLHIRSPIKSLLSFETKISDRQIMPTPVLIFRPSLICFSHSSSKVLQKCFMIKIKRFKLLTWGLSSQTRLFLSPTKN